MKYCNTLIKFLLIVSLQITLRNCQWPKVENLKKSMYLPSLEVRVHPPDEFQPKVQAEVKKLELSREKNERKYMQDLENAYNDELVVASEKIDKIVTDGLSIFEDDNLLAKSVEYAVNPPIVVFASSQTAENQGAEVPPKTPGLTPSFKEVANISMNKLQRKTMNILVEDDLKIEKLRNPTITIFNEKSSKIVKNKNFLRKDKKKLNNHKTHELKNGPIAISDDLMMYSFLESEVSVKEGDDKYSKPIAVKVKLPSEPDPKIQKEISKMEKKREDYEKKMFEKAKQEFKLITSITIKELQVNLQHELIPYFVVSKKSMDQINQVVEGHVLSPKSRFLQIDRSEINNKFPNLRMQNSTILNNEENLNKYTYQKILSLFSNLPESSLNKELLNNDALSEKKFINNIKANLKSVINKKMIPQTEKKVKKITQDKLTQISNKKFKENLDYDEKTCLEISKKLTKNLANIHFNCSEYSNDYETLKDEFKNLYSSFLETQFRSKQEADDFINVKLGANDDTYPTIEKLVSQMMNRRDLSEKFERLKILEFETHLQKAENEMIQDILHEKLYKIMAKYGPAIEGVKEHIK